LPPSGEREVPEEGAAVNEQIQFPNWSLRLPGHAKVAFENDVEQHLAQADKSFVELVRRAEDYAQTTSLHLETGIETELAFPSSSAAQASPPIDAQPQVAGPSTSFCASA